MTLTPDQKNHAIDLIERNDKLEAVRYLQETLGLTADQALTLTEKLEEENESQIESEFKAMRARAQTHVNSKMPRMVGMIFMGFGIIMLAVVGYIIKSNYEFSRRAIPVMGKVIGFNNHESSDDDGGSTTMYTPIFEYNYNAQTYTYTSSASSSSPTFDIGENVEILVDPDSPGDVLVNAFWEKWLLPIILGFMGTMFTGLGYMAYRVLGKSVV